MGYWVSVFIKEGTLFNSIFSEIYLYLCKLEGRDLFCKKVVFIFGYLCLLVPT